MKIPDLIGQSSALFYDAINNSNLTADAKLASCILYSENLGRKIKLPRKLKKRILGSK